MTSWLDSLFVLGSLGLALMLMVVLLVQRLYTHPALQKEEEDEEDAEEEEDSDLTRRDEGV